MAIALRAAKGSNNAGGGTTLTMTVPAGVVNGDVMVMSIFLHSSVGITDPSGWTVLDTGGGSQSHLYWRVASSEPASYAVTIGSEKATGVIIALSGADTSLPGSTQHAFNFGTSATLSAIALGTFSSNNGIDLFFGGTATGTTTGQPASYTEPTNGSSTNTGGGAGTRSTSGVAYRALSAVTTVGSLSAVYGASAFYNTYHCFIFEAAQVASVPTLQQYSQSVNRAANW